MDPDPAFYFNRNPDPADPDPGSQINVDLCGVLWTYLSGLFIHILSISFLIADLFTIYCEQIRNCSTDPCRSRRAKSIRIYLDPDPFPK
jgi:hypothetical protein